MIHQQKLNFSLVCSALLYAVSFFKPCYFFWTIFIFLVPIFYVSVSGKSLTFKHGFLWGIVFWSFHLQAILFLLHEHAEGGWKYGAWFMLVWYFASLSGVWFWGVVTLRRYCSLFFAWIVGSIAYFWWLRTFGLLILGNVTGYCFALPLLPLAAHPHLLYCLSYVNGYILLLLLIGGQFFIAQFFYWRQLQFFKKIFLCCIPFFIGFLIPHKKKGGDFFDNFGYLMPPTNRQHPLDIAQHLYTDMITLKEQFSSVKYFVTPESTIPFSLNLYPEIIELFQENILSDDNQLILGSYYENNNKLYNRLYFLSDNDKEIIFYDKKKLSPLVEFIPLFWKTFLKSIKNMFLHNKKEMCAGLLPPPLFSFQDDKAMIPQICSDIFYGDVSCINKKKPILLAVNDSWFSCQYQRNLMALFAQYTSLDNDIEILYVGFYHAHVYFPRGVRPFKIAKIEL